VCGYAHAETAEPGEQVETHIRFRDVICLLAVNLHDAANRDRDLPRLFRRFGLPMARCEVS
jgi:hypothetical protein